MEYFRAPTRGDINDIVEDEDGRLWLCGSNGLWSFDVNAKESQIEPLIIDGVSFGGAQMIHDILIAGEGWLYIGTNESGLFKIDIGVDSTQRTVVPIGQEEIPDIKQISCLREDRAGLIWLGGRNLVCHNPSTGSFIRYQNDPGDQSTISPGLVRAIYEDRQRHLWLGISGSGLDRLDPKTGIFTHYRMQDGLPGEMVFGFQEDDDGHLWIQTERGLCKFNPQEKTFIQYNVFDGVESHEGNLVRNSVTGEMLVGSGGEGLVYFHPDSLKENSYPPPVVITAFKKYLTEEDSTKVIEVPGIGSKESITLAYGENTFTISFAALSFESPLQNQYAYQMVGMDDHWIDLGTEKQDYLQPGPERTVRL